MNPDWQLMKKARNGDESAWKSIQDQYARRLMKMALFITGYVETAEDVLQDTFLYLLSTKPKHEAGSFASYIFTVAYHKSLKEKKRHGLKEKLNRDFISENTLTPLEQTLDNERDKLISKIIINLDDIYRDIVILRFYAEKSYNEIAESLGIPVGTVKSRLFNAVKKCREELKRKGL